MTKEKLMLSIKNGMFADRNSLEEAFKYVGEIAKASENPMAVWTAVMVVCNTVSNEIKKIETFTDYGKEQCNIG